MAICLCRWPNGEFSIVNAKTKDDAIELLDEWGNAEQGSKQVRDAVESERKRLWDSQPPAREAETLVGRDIQRQLGAASVVVNRIVQGAARKRLKSKDGDGGKPN